MGNTRAALRRFGRSATWMAWAALWALAAGCSDDQAPAAAAADAADSAAGADDAKADTQSDTSTPAKQLSFCAPVGKAAVRQLKAGEALQGPAALGTEGDWVLANDRAAFVVQKPGGKNSYYYYGGLPIDAAPLRREGAGCVQAGPETFGELALAVGTLNPADFPQSVLRGFAGESAEIVADGSDGQAAVLRIWGSDQIFWLVEMELILRAHAAGGLRPRSQPLGLQMALDYVLQPGAAAVEMRLHLFNQNAQAQGVVAGAAVFPDDSTLPQVYFANKLDLSGLGLQAGVPWFAALGPSSWALAAQAENLARINLSGVDALIDIGQLGEPVEMAPKGQAGEEAQRSWWLAVAPGGTDAALAALQEQLPKASQAAMTQVTGQVVEQAAALPVSGAIAVLQRQNKLGWQDLVSTAVDAGAFALQVPTAADGAAQRIEIRKAGWPTPPAIALPAPGPIKVAMASPGRVAYQVADTSGKPMPAKVFFYQQGELVRREYTATGSGDVELPAGSYDVTVARGYEYGLFEGKLDISAQASTSLSVKLPPVVDSAGFLSLDGHVHSAPSPDSTVPMAMRFVTAAAEGLEVVMHTDHEIITDPLPELLASGVQGWVASVPGEELTASSPEHLNLWGTPPDPSHVRGNPVPWYDKDLAQLYAAGRARGAQVVTLNHPRQAGACGYLCQVDWDRVAGAPKLSDPEAIGLPKGATLWSWDFDAVELMNGLGNPFAAGVDAKRNGIFDDWMSFLNHGHRIAGIGVTDVHDYNGVGTPRTYFAAPTDKPSEFKMAMAKEAIKSGKILVSAGAFARVTLLGKGLGETVSLPGGKGELQVEIQGMAAIDVERIMVLANCDEVASAAASAPGGTTKFKGSIPLALGKDAHVVVVAFGKNPLPRSFDPADAKRVPRVITNPIYVDVDGDGQWTAPGGKTCSYSVGP